MVSGPSFAQEIVWVCLESSRQGPSFGRFLFRVSVVLLDLGCSRDYHAGQGKRIRFDLFQLPCLTFLFTRLLHPRSMVFQGA